MPTNATSITSARSRAASGDGRPARGGVALRRFATAAALPDLDAGAAPRLDAAAVRRFAVGSNRRFAGDAAPDFGAGAAAGAVRRSG
ncbi:hypothetical protein, partial [Streptacidiphilus griseoplanus]|uniref:hypothetical protein n=1 Tax=Peterkaempfera griseoplana TaxID=66896 RepID=UPI001FE17A8A